MSLREFIHRAFKDIHETLNIDAGPIVEQGYSRLYDDGVELQGSTFRLIAETCTAIGEDRYSLSVFLDWDLIYQKRLERNASLDRDDLLTSLNRELEKRQNSVSRLENVLKYI